MFCGINDIYVLTDLWKGYFYQIVLEDLRKFFMKRMYNNVMSLLRLGTVGISHSLDTQFFLNNYMPDSKYSTPSNYPKKYKKYVKDNRLFSVVDWSSGVYMRNITTRGLKVQYAKILKPFGYEGWRMVLSDGFTSIVNLMRIHKNDMEWFREHK